MNNYGMGEWGEMLPTEGKRKSRGPSKITSQGPPPKTPLLQRFMDKIEAHGTHWIWQGGTNRGYGVITVDDQAKYAHRVAWELFKNEKIPDRRRIHPCLEVELCVYPGHLSLMSNRTRKLPNA